MYKRHVVIVEDDAFLRSLLAEYLENAGFLVTTAGTAADARRAIKSVDPDAVVLDIDLGPGPNGLDIGEALLAHSADISVVYLTGLSDVRFIDENKNKVHPRAAYLNKTRIEDGTVLVDALESVLQEKDIAAYRHDKDGTRPLAHLSQTQIQILKMVAEGKTNQQIATLRQRSLSATEGTIARAFNALGIDLSSEGNSRVLAARTFLAQSGLVPKS